LILRPTGALKKLFDQADITSEAIAKVGYDRIGTALADSIAAGFSPQRAAKVITEKIGDPARALTIAITEQNRAMSLATIDRYQEAGLDRVEWVAADPCDICAPNEGQIVPVGQAFASGDTEPPVHPNCRCALLPVISGMVDDASFGQDYLNSLDLQDLADYNMYD
jgi:SPP1 gp7 family putative phage head morphogenesis protein